MISPTHVVRTFVLLIGVVVFTAVVPQFAVAAAAPKTKDALIQNILDQLTFMYSDDRDLIGKTFKVTIKDFSVNDDKTYLIIDGVARTNTYVIEEVTADFWTVTLPRGLKKIDPEYYKDNDLSILLGGQHRVEVMRKDLVSATRKNGIVREITIPKKRKELQ
jgi:hypothetical protein